MDLAFYKMRARRGSARETCYYVGKEDREVCQTLKSFLTAEAIYLPTSSS